MSFSTANKMQQEKEGWMHTASRDNAIMKQVQATHAPRGREIAVNPIINITEQILIQAIACSTGGVQGKSERPETTKKAPCLAELNAHDALIIQKLSRELFACKLTGVEHTHAKTMELLNTLCIYPWHAKVVLVLSGFAVNFGEFWLVAQPCPDILSKSLALLRKLPNIGDKSPLKRQFDLLNKLVKATLDVTKCILEVNNLPFHYIAEEGAHVMSVANALIPFAVYSTIQSILTCSSQIATVISLRNEYISSSTEAWELSQLARVADNILNRLKNQLDSCYRYIDEKIIYESLYSNENLQTEVNIGVQRRKHMLLLISDLDILEEEIQVLDKLYKDQLMQSETLYEMVWVPIVDKSTSNSKDLNEDKFEQLKSMMSWYSFQNPLTDPVLIKQIREEWNFVKRFIVVVRDPKGKVSSTNAIDMMRIWGNLAFPFTRETEEDLWNAQDWSLKLIVGGIDATILEWMTEGKDICLYGSDDLEWIRTFTKTAMSAARAANIKLEMVYVGRPNVKELMQRIISTFAKEKFSHFLPNVISIRLFWARLESMLYSKLKQNKTVENDQIMREVLTILSFDGSDEGWAIFTKGAAVMVKAKGTKALRGLNEFEYWKANAKRNGFMPAFKEYLEELQSLYWIIHRIAPVTHTVTIKRD